MNKNFLKISYPSIPSNFTHILLEEAQYIEADYDSFPPKGKLPFNDKIKVLEKGTYVTLLEYGLGYKAAWSKIKLISEKEEKLYYVESVLLKPIDEIVNKYPGTSVYPTYSFPVNPDKEYQPNDLAPFIDWKLQEKNIVYEDKRSANFCVHYEVDITEISGEEDLKQNIKNACYSGTSLILKSKGFKHDLELVESLVENYYTFSKAEEYYFPLRPCSTLRVLVTLPTRIIYAKDLNGTYVLKPEKSEVTLINPSSFADSLGNINLGFGQNMAVSNVQSEAENKNLIKLTYKNKFDLDLHFSYIMLNLSWYFSIFSFPPGRLWRITPTETPDIIPGFGALNLPFEQNRLGNLFTKINEFIYKNLSEQVNLLQDEGRQNFLKIYNTDFSVSKPEDFISISDLLSINKTTALDFNGELQIFIDKNNLQLTKIKLFSNDLKEIELNIESEAFYRHESVLNKTSLNYLLKIQPPTEFLKNIERQFKQLSERKDLTEFGKLVNNIITNLDSTLAIPEYLLGEKDQSLEKFLRDNHYPIIDSVFAQPIDFGACADRLGSTFENRVAHLTASYDPVAKLEQINKFRKDIENYKKSGGANLFIKSLTDADSIQDENFKILIGKKPAKGPTSDQKLNQYLAAANMFDWPRFLREAIKCSGAKFDAERFTNIMNDYEKFMLIAQNPDLLLLCNPLANKVQNILDQIVKFSLPAIPVYNPQESLANELKNLIVNLVNDLVVFVIRGLITGAIKDCTRDNNPDFSNSPDSLNANTFNNLANNIDRFGNDRNVDSLLNSYFGLDNEINNQSDISPDTIRNQFKQLLKSFLEDVIACLTTKELCVLLTGGTLEEDAYDVIFSILRRKYNTPEKSYNLAAKLNSKEEITLFFKKIRNTYDLRICEDIANDTSPIIPANPLCDDGRKEAREKAILHNKGIPDDLINDLLNDIKQKDEESLRNILDFLNKENPFDLNNIPTVLCKKGPNGEIIPPLVSLSPPLKSFNGMIDSIYKQIYDNFDEEAKTWYKNTYSVSSSVSKDNLKFDEKGLLVFNNDLARTGESDANKKNKPDSPTEKTLPSYIFKDLLQSNLIFQNDRLSEVVLEGYKEQILELVAVKDEDRKNVQKVYTNLKLFAESLIYLLDTYKLIVATNGINNFEDKPELNEFLQRDFSVFLKLVGSFYVNTVAVINDPDKNSMVKRVLNFQDSDYANSLFAEEKPVSFVRVIMNYLVIDETFKNNLIQTINTLKQNLVEETAIAGIQQINITYSDPNSFLTNTGELITTYKKFEGSYKKFVTVEKVLNSFPTFKITLRNNNTIVKRNETTKRNELYDQNKIVINKNGYDYINKTVDTLVDNEILQYITGALNISLESISEQSKKSIFDKFINYSKNKFPNSIHTSSLDFSLKKKDDKISEKIFDDFGFQQNPSSFLQPNFSGLKLLLNKQIDNTILASPFLETVSFNVAAPSNTNFQDFGDDTRPTVSLKPPNLKDGPPKNNTPLTQYMTLVIPQTSTQKACNIRPHYLDIDSVKTEMATAKEESYCLEESKNEKVKKGEEIKTSELANIELNDTQFIMLDGTYRLYLRTHLHEIMLRAIAIYGSYDPQSIRKNDLFISLMTDLLEAEIRSKDNTLFLMMANYFAKAYQFKNPHLTELPSHKELIKQVVSYELKNNILPKMSKRIYEDTNQKFAFLNPPKKASLTTIEDYYKEKNNILYINSETKAVYVRVTGTQFIRPQNPNSGNSQNISDSLTTLINKQSTAANDAAVDRLKYFKQEIYFQKVYQSKQQFTSADGPEKIKSIIIREFAQTVEYKLLFKYLFPLENELTFRHFAAVFGCGTKKSSVDSFRTVKNTIAMIAKKMSTNGVSVAPDKNNFQDMENNDQSKMFVKFIIEALIKAPIQIVKGFTELTEPNIALSSKAYLLTKSFVPETPSFMVPAISFPLGIPNPLFPLGIIPWVNIPLALFYLIGGLWYEDNSPLDSQAKDFMDKLLSGGLADVSLDCSNVTNPDTLQTSIIYDGEPGYNFLNPSSDFIIATDEQINSAQEDMLNKLKVKEQIKELKKDLAKQEERSMPLLPAGRRPFNIK